MFRNDLWKGGLRNERNCILLHRSSLNSSPEAIISKSFSSVTIDEQVEQVESIFSSMVTLQSSDSVSITLLIFTEFCWGAMALYSIHRSEPTKGVTWITPKQCRNVLRIIDTMLISVDCEHLHPVREIPYNQIELEICHLNETKWQYTEFLLRPLRYKCYWLIYELEGGKLRVFHSLDFPIFFSISTPNCGKNALDKAIWYFDLDTSLIFDSINFWGWMKIVTYIFDMGDELMSGAATKKPFSEKAKTWHVREPN